MLDVTRLRVLVAVARHGSVTAAARELNYAQPSVSHHLARLEAETGVRLIQRAGRGIRLTDAGRLLADRAAEILGRLDAAENELAAHAGLRAGRVRLAAFPSALGTIVPAAAAMLHVVVPTWVFERLAADPVLGVALMASLAVVLALCSEADAFVAASMTMVPLLPRLVFLVVGPAVDVKLFAMQAGLFGRAFAARFAPCTFLVATASACAVGLLVLGGG